MNLISIILFAVALSFDGFGVGVAYGIKNIRIPIKSLLVISLTSSTAIGLSMLLGTGISKVVSVLVAERIGASLLIIMGVWLLIQSLISQETEQDKEHLTGETVYNDILHTGGLLEEPLFRLQIKPLGLVIQILRQPVKADIDQSGTISPREAVFLGIALAMDALGSGIGAAMAGFSILLTIPIVGIVKFILVSCGGLIGRKFSATWLGNWASVIPGCVLILLGISNLGL